ncbi:MAG: hypothetical protein LRY75_16610 [Shewanella xiamenensis]|jgi:hypothetical protein|uniref:Uncharacterized protein n=2 Tax=Shewanella TaxID=22 RepID=A0AAE4Q6M1_9GAMM|nr:MULTISPECIES: hypothetical protein [Shewanella]MCD8552106.1 hypothetical protein [Shewanella xiamenensis]MCD8560395.1 hypothetical protein [Shewanella xiamenensis]MCK7657652.1 hypothetical protein [Shewanella sp. JNE4-2]MCT8858159.1 hypothetical protein [Shewanella xiamenensis]MDH0451103.1 hypothetical protein [Shewanella sp. GD04112]
MQHKFISSLARDTAALIYSAMETENFIFLKMLGITTEEATEIIELANSHSHPEEMNKPLFQKVMPVRLD